MINGIGESQVRREVSFGMNIHERAPNQQKIYYYVSLLRKRDPIRFRRPALNRRPTRRLPLFFAVPEVHALCRIRGCLCDVIRHLPQCFPGSMDDFGCVGVWIAARTTVFSPTNHEDQRGKLSTRIIKKSAGVDTSQTLKGHSARFPKTNREFGLVPD